MDPILCYSGAEDSEETFWKSCVFRFWMEIDVLILYEVVQIEYYP